MVPFKNKKNKGWDNHQSLEILSPARPISFLLSVLKAESMPNKSSNLFPESQNTVQKWSPVKAILSACVKTPRK